MVTFAFDDFVFDSRRGDLWRQGVRVGIDRQPLEALGLLLRHSERVVAKHELVAEIWGGRAQSDQAVSVCMARLRKALGGPPDEYIKTIYGQGYRFVGLVTLGVEKPRPTARRPQITATHDDPADGPIVGRAAELNRLRMALSLAESGRGRACALTGEAGIGKTRLAEALRLEALAAGFAVSWGSGHLFDDVPPLWPWHQVFESRTHALPSELLEHPFKGLATDQPGSPWHHTIDWLRTAISKLTADKPWLIVLENLHWADAATLALITHVVADISRQPLLLVLTARDTELPDDAHRRQALDYVLGHRACENIQLSRLIPGDVSDYLERKFSSVDDGLARTVLHRSEGNPFFMVELLRGYDAENFPDASALRIPEQALDILRQQLRRLEPTVVETLAAAAVIGHAFDLGALMFVAQRTADGLVGAVGAALTAKIIQPVADSAVNFQFCLGLLRQVLYEDLAIATRAKLHERAAAALLQRSSVDDPGIAAHLLRATPFTDIAQAIRCGRRAAAAAARSGAYRDACDLLRRCIDAWHAQTDAAPALLAATLYDLASCERAAGDAGSAHHLAESLRLARKHELVEVLFCTARRMSGTPGVHNETDALSALEAALGLLARDDHHRRARLLCHLAWTVPSTRDGNRVELMLKEAQQLAADASTPARRDLLRARVYFAGGPDDHERTLALATELEELAQDRDPRTRALAAVEPSLARTMTYMQSCNFAAARRALDGYWAAVNTLQHAELRWQYERTAMALEISAGDLSLVRERVLHSKCEADRLELPDRQAIAALDWCELNRLTIDIRPVAARYVQHLRPAPHDDPTTQSAKLRTLAHCELIEEARAGLHRVTLDKLYALPKSRDYLAQLANLSLAAAATDTRPHVQALYELLQPYPKLYISSLSVHCHGVVSHVLGVLSCSLGLPHRAREHFEDAVRQQERLNLTLPLVRTRFELGAMLIKSRVAHERAQGSSILEQAHLTACKLGLERSRVEIEQLLAKPLAINLRSRR